MRARLLVVFGLQVVICSIAWVVTDDIGDALMVWICMLGAAVIVYVDDDRMAILCIIVLAIEAGVVKMATLEPTNLNVSTAAVGAMVLLFALLYGMRRSVQTG